jgi:hypothetical protein
MTDEELDARLREAVNSEAVDTASLERAIRSQTRRSYRGWYVAAAAIAAVVLLAIFVRPVPAAFHEAARDHRLEVVEHRPRRWQTKVPEELPVTPANYRLEHSKICRIEGKPVLHLVYTDGSREVSVYVDAAAGRGDTDVDGQHVTAFRTARMSGLVVGPAAECRQFAAVIQRLT